MASFPGCAAVLGVTLISLTTNTLACVIGSLALVSVSDLEPLLAP